MPRAAHAVAAIVVATSALACLDLGPLPEDAEHFAVPPIYRLWWSEVEACSGLRGNIDSVRFYRIPGDAFIYEGKVLDGLYDRSAHHIVVSTASERRGHIVRHEMLHALTRTLNHSHKQFRRQCGGVVVCEADCRNDAGADPPARGSAVRVSPFALEISVAPARERPSRSRYDELVPIVVLVRNPFPYEVLLDTVYSNGFIVNRESPDGPVPIGVTELATTDRHFLPHETKRGVFDLRLEPITVLSGMLDVTMQPEWLHGVRASYAGRWTGLVTLTSVP